MPRRSRHPRRPRPRTSSVFLAICATLLAALAPAAGAAQIDEEPRNLRFFPPDIGRDSLIQVMRGFSFALGVRCQYCHVGGDGISFEGVDFASDEDPDKRKARFMLRMVETINRSMLPMMPQRDEPPYEIGCKSCHRGRPKPTLLTDVLRRSLDARGADSATATYRALREQAGLRGMFDFGEWETNVLAERLTQEGRSLDAIAIYEINAEFYPESFSIQAALGGLYREVADTVAAIRAYERALEILPGNETVTENLRRLRGGAGGGTP